MQQATSPDGQELVDAQLGRSQSLTGGDRLSMSGLSPIHTSPPTTANPAPAYIAASAASGIITGDHSGLPPEQSAELISDVVSVSAASLALINGFLDQLLYNFLATARSTSLASLRPAVAEVLKPRLAKDAIAGADEELREFLGGGDDEELTAFHGGQEPRGDWDLELVWKLTRLRCMVYTRLGDMEEDDEDEYIEQEQLDGSGGGPRRFSSHLGTVSPAAAIFLTSIMEFVGEQTLMIAGEAARNRILSRREPPSPQTSHGMSIERLTVEEGDTEKIALDRTFGRLWRTWRRRIRSPSHSMSRPISRDSFFRRGHSSVYSPRSRQSSFGTIEDSHEQEDSSMAPNVAEVLHQDDPAKVPLPINDNDINEIEVPGIAQQEDEREDRSATSIAITKGRPQSMLAFRSHEKLPTPTSPTSLDDEGILNDRPVGRVRSRSLPTPVQTPYASPSDEEPVSAESTFATPLETADPMEELEVPESSEEQLRTPTAESHGRRTKDDEEHSKTGMMTDIAAGAAGLGAAAVGTAAAVHIPPRSMQQANNKVHIPQETPHAANQDNEENIEHQEARRVVDEEDASARTPMASTMNVPSIQHHLVGELANGKDISKRGSRASEIYVYVKKPHHGRDPSLTTTEAGDDYDYRNDPLDHEGGSQGVADPEDLALSDNEEQVATRDESKAFVLSPPPIGKNRSSEYPVKREDVTGTELVSSSPTASRAPRAENGAPPLTPLRELMEAAHDTSDEASRSSMGASQKRDSLPSQERAPSGQSSRSDPHSSYSQKHISAGSRFSDYRNQAVMLPQQPYHQAAVSSSSNGNVNDRAGVQRVTPPPLTPREAGATRNQRSESLGSIDKRPQTSGSATSRVSRKQTLPVRTSVEGPTGAIGDNPRSTVDPESFDNLVASGQTIIYTLTPQNMREMESPSSPRWSNKPKTSTSELADFLKTTGPPDDERPKTGRSGTSNKGLNGLRSHPPEPMPRSPTGTQPATTLKHRSTDLVQAAGQNPKRKILGTGAQEPRDPRVERSSTRDFADFIRSTGPQSPEQLPTTISSPRASSRPTTASADSAPPPAFASQMQVSNPGENSPKVSRSQMAYSTPSTTSSGPRRSGSKLEARPPTLTGNKSSDLIDFIREGPPSDPRDGNHRIPRTTAPFRATTDSDEISALGIVGPGAVLDKDATARVSVASTQESSIPTVSVHSSSNSRTGLLESTNQPGARTSNQVVTPRPQTRNDRSDLKDDIRPQRKQRRVRDPYAIDSDSEEDVRHTAPKSKPKPKRDEESLIDFLRNVAPPTESQTTPQLLDTPAASAAMQKKNGAAPNIKDRIMRKSSVSIGPSKGRQRAEPSAPPPRRSSNSAINTVVSANPPQLPPPRPVSPHLSQTGSRRDTYKPTTPTYAAHIDRVRGNKHIERGLARNDSGSSTADLADFLRNSGPPPTNQTYAPSATKEEGGFSRMFSRRRGVLRPREH